MLKQLSAAVAFAALVATAFSQDVEAGRAKAAVCAACHGADGNSPSPEFPILAGQSARYLYLQLKDIKEGRRTIAAMQPFVEKLERADM